MAFPRYGFEVHAPQLERLLRYRAQSGGQEEGSEAGLWEACLVDRRKTHGTCIIGASYRWDLESLPPQHRHQVNRVFEVSDNILAYI